jgi:hypothetical protein
MTDLLEAHTLLCLSCKAYGSHSVKRHSKINAGYQLVVCTDVNAGGGECSFTPRSEPGEKNLNVLDVRSFLFLF